jgi:hypothetical protein
MREARLRPEFANVYPELTPGQWEPAARIAEVVLARFLLLQQTTGAPGDRALDETHFEFRGGTDPERPPLRERFVDRTDTSG